MIAPSTLTGFPVAVCEWFKGSKNAVETGGTIYVSPAMWELMKDATPQELEHLLGKIGLIRIPAFDPFAPFMVYGPGDVP